MAGLGMLLFSVAILKKSWFAIWQPTVYLLPVFLIGGLLLLLVYGGRLTGLRPAVPLVVLGVLELCLAIDLHLAAMNQQGGIMSRNMLQELYLNELRSIPFLTSTSGCYNEDFFYTLRPGQSTFSNLEYTNELNIHASGFRAEEQDFRNGEIVFLGDSFTMGWGVEAEQAFPKVVEKLSGMQILNLGMPSFGTARELMAWKKYRPESSRLVVWQFCANDTSENSAYVHNDLDLEISPRWTYEAARRRNELQQYYYPLKYSSSLLRCALRRAFGSPMEASTEPCLEQFFAIVAKWKEEVDLPLVIMDLEGGKPDGGWYAAMKDFLRQNPMPQVYLFPVNELLSENDYYLMDDHLNSEGHRKVAQGLWNFILTNNILQPAQQEVSFHL
ncbi:MAG: hypothetical protein CMN32_07990 [Saprospirales bacterium]|nr:hypothetical protein [Saprospirales bacterium]